MRDSLGERRRLVRRVPLLLLTAAALVYLIQRSVLTGYDEIDFRFIWLAGHMWAIGQDPYAPAYTRLGAQLFSQGNAIAYWLYPPQWWIVCRALALTDPAHAIVWWRGVGALCAWGGALVCALGMRRADRRFPAAGLLLALVYVSFIQATPTVLSMGQTSLVIFAGLALVAFALLAESEAAMAAGVVLCLLKPHVGVVVLAGLAFAPRWWRAVLIAGAISVLLCVPQFAAFGIGPTARQFLANVGQHGTIAANAPENLTGLTQLAWRLGIVLPTLAAVGLGAVAAALIGWRLGRAGDASSRAAFAIGLTAACCFFLPLHSYDMVLFAPIGILLWALDGTSRALLAAATLLLFRPANLARLLGAQAPLASASTPRELFIEMLGTLLALLVAARLAARARPA